MSGWKEISDLVLKHDYCCGCGLCAGLCPQNSLEMRFNQYGEYKPYLLAACTSCGLCSKICPSIIGGQNEEDIGKVNFGSVPGMAYTAETGYYLDSYVGYSTDAAVRWRAASGGLLTWTLTTLIEKSWIEYAVCVKPCSRPDRLFEFVICESPDEIRSCSKSCYYPVELSEVLSAILNRGGRCAIVGLPCVLKGLRKAEDVNGRLKERIAYHLGLACGHQNSALFAEYICSLGGGNPRDLASVSFRVKDRRRPSSDYGLRFRCGRNGNSGGVVFWTEGMKQAWCSGWFKLNACNYCDDLFAEVADAAYMDAWLPQYTKDSLGTNLLLVRAPRLLELLKEGKESNQIDVEHIDVEDIISSQRGALTAKRETLAKRVAFARCRGLPTPEKRVNRVSRLSFRSRLQLRMERAVIDSSKTAFKIQKGIGKGLWAFRLWMRIRLLPMRILNWTARCASAVRRRVMTLENK